MPTDDDVARSRVPDGEDVPPPPFERPGSAAFESASGVEKPARDMSRLKAAVAAVTAAGGLVGALAALLSAVGPFAGNGDDAAPRAPVGDARPTDPGSRTWDVTGRYRLASDRRRAVQVQAPAEWVARTLAFDPVKGRPEGPGVVVYPRGSNNDEDWTAPFLFVGASRSFVKVLRLAQLDDKGAVNAVRGFLAREYDWTKEDCRLVIARLFEERGYRGIEKRWGECGPNATGSVWEVFAYSKDRSVVTQFQFFRPADDPGLEDVAETARATFAAVPERVSSAR